MDIEFQKIAEDVLRKHELTDLGWSFVYDRAKTRAGYCNYIKKRISLSIIMVRDSSISLQDKMNILLHEVAHALVGSHKRPHNNEWRRKAREIGCSKVSRCHNLHFCSYRYKLRCPCGRVDEDRHHIKKIWKITRCPCCLHVPSIFTL